MKPIRWTVEIAKHAPRDEMPQYEDTQCELQIYLTDDEVQHVRAAIISTLKVLVEKRLAEMAQGSAIVYQERAEGGR